MGYVFELFSELNIWVNVKSCLCTVCWCIFLPVWIQICIQKYEFDLNSFLENSKRYLTLFFSGFRWLISWPRPSSLAAFLDRTGRLGLDLARLGCPLLLGDVKSVNARFQFGWRPTRVHVLSTFACGTWPLEPSSSSSIKTVPFPREQRVLARSTRS